MEWLQSSGNNDDNFEAFVAPRALAETTLAIDVTTLERIPTVQKEKHFEPTTQTTNNPKSTNEPWLNEELLQRVFG